MHLGLVPALELPVVRQEQLVLIVGLAVPLLLLDSFRSLVQSYWHLFGFLQRVVSFLYLPAVNNVFNRRNRHAVADHLSHMRLLLLKLSLRLLLHKSVDTLVEVF